MSGIITANGDYLFVYDYSVQLSVYIVKLYLKAKVTIVDNGRLMGRAGDIVGSKQLAVGSKIRNRKS